MRAFVAAVLLVCSLGRGQASLPAMPSRPAGDTEPVLVSYAAWIADIRGIDSVAQTFTANLVVVLRWHDPALAHPGPGTKRYSLDEIWHPRLLIANEAESSDPSLPLVADVTPDGSAVYRQRIIGTFAQSLNLRAFPFDGDTLYIRFVLLGHSPGEIDFAPDDAAVSTGMVKGVGIAKTLTVQDWRVREVAARTEPYKVTPEMSLAGFLVEISAERRSHHFLIKVILPLILIVAMSWTVFWIEPNDANTQMAVAITAMLTLIAYRFAIDSDVPKLPYLTKLDAFVLMSTLLVFLSIIEVMVTTKFANRDRTDDARKIDRCCRWAFPLAFAVATVICFF
jgi:hypothetical protein